MRTELPIMIEAARVGVALRMLGFEARTRTIRLATQLSDDKIRCLYHHGGLAAITARHRGRSPSSAAQYTRNFAAQLESSIVTGVLVKHGLLKAAHHRLHKGLLYAQKFCDAYAEYLQLAQLRALNFEQAWFLARMLCARGKLYLQSCSQCHGHFVRDTTTVLRPACPLCQLRTQLNAKPPAVKSGSRSRRPIAKPRG